MNNKSPLRYPGGKTRACKILDEIVNQNFNMKEKKILISPFFGGGSFEFYLQNKYNLDIIANDKFHPLFVFWNFCKYRNKALCDELYKMGEITKDMFTSYRYCIMDEEDMLQKAVYYFIINRCSFSGATLSGGFSSQAAKKRFTKSSIDRIKKLDLSKFMIQNAEFDTFIKAYQSSDDVIIFLDPPYFLEKGNKLYGKNGNMHENFDHNKLFRCISKKSNWIMTYNNCEFIRNLYKSYKIIDAEWSYGMNKSKKSSEIVIIGHSTSFQCPKILLK